MRTSIAVTGLLGLLATVAVAAPAAADSTGGHGREGNATLLVRDPVARCAGLAGRTISPSTIGLPTRGAAVITSTLVPADTSGTPEYCKVVGRVDSFDPTAPPINFQLNLPTRWARRTMQLGGGGFNGTVITGLGNVPGTAGDGPATPLERSYATFGSDSGNAVGTNPPGSFGTNPESFANYAGESVKRTRDAAQALIRAYYGAKPRLQYFAGGSKGGHEALVAAQRYADDYDGIIAYYPASQNLFLIYGWDNLLRLAYDTPGGALNAAKQQLVTKALFAACDGLDGVTDGVIANRSGCQHTFDVASLTCLGGGDTGDTCLSATQVATIRSAASPAALPYPAPNGTTTTGPFPVLAGGHLDAWMNDAFRIYDFFDTGVIRYWYLKNPAATDAEVNGFDWTTHRAQVDPVAQQFDAVSPNIDRFLGHGGKLIIVQGTADMLVPPAATDSYVNTLQDRYGRKLRDAVRYFVQPGYGHDVGLFGGDFDLSWDSLSALDRWVTEGDAPEHPVALDAHAGTAGRTMPLCEYPAWPRYRGTGDTTLASSYRCVRNDGGRSHDD